MRLRLHVLGILLVALALTALPPHTTHAQSNRLCFNTPGITNCIEGRFRAYWEANGGLAVFGYPISAAANRTSAEGTFLTQDFERNRFELHPEKSAPYDVLLGRLGDDILKAQGLNWQTFSKANKRDDCSYFPETGHNVCDLEPGAGFRSYWVSHGLQDPMLDGYGRSLALFGYPIAEAGVETNADGDTVITQWFERARFEWHPNNPAAFRVLLGRLGNESKLPVKAQGLPADVPWMSVAGRIVGAQPSQPMLTLPKGDAYAQYVPSPDGSLLVHDQQMTIGNAGFEFARIVASTGERTRLLTTPNGVIAPQFSPDSRSVVFSLTKQNTWELHILDVASGNDRMVASGALDGRVLLPLAWTARGIYVGEAIWGSDAQLSNLQTLDPATGARQTVYADAFLNAVPSADGKRLAILTGNPGMGSTPELTIRSLDITNGRTTTLAANIAEGVLRMEWSPDGARLLYITTLYQQGRSTLHLVGANGANHSWLTFQPLNTTATLQDARWRDNATLLVANADQHAINIYTLPANDLRPERLASQVSITERMYQGQFARILYVPR